MSTAGVIHVDLPPTIGRNMLFTIGNVTSQPITYIVYSRPQADHIGVASLVAGAGKPVEVIAREDTKELLQEASDASRPLPTVTFKDDYRLRVGQPDAGAALRRREPRPRQHLHLRAGAEAARPHRRRFPPAGSPSRTWPPAATSPTRCWRTTSRTMSAGTWGGLARAPTCWCRRGMQDLRAASKRSTSRRRVIRCRARRLCKGRLSS